jgi:hypothetical protein
VPHRIGISPVAMSGRSRRHSRVAARRVSGRITRNPSSSPPRQRISANRDSSSAVDTVLDDGTTLVRNIGELENGTIFCMDPPSAAFIAAAIGAGSGLPVTWLGATNGTSDSATP